MQKNKINYNQLLENTLEYWPQIIFCDDMKLSGNDGAIIDYLNKFYFELLDDKLNESKEDFISILSWSIKCIITRKAIKVYKKEGFCKYIDLNDIDYQKLKEHFIEQINVKENKELLEKDNIEIVY